MRDELEEIRQVFISECGDLLQEMEVLLLHAEAGGSTDSESINALFRAVHTIKGTAAMFAYDDVVRFAHIVENLMDHVREGRLRLNSRLVSLLLNARDHLSELVRFAAEDQAADEDARAAEARLVGELQTFLSSVSGPAEDGASVAASLAPPDPESEPESTSVPGAPESGPGTPSGDEGAPRAANPNWHISLRCGTNMFRSGLDPLSFLRYLRELGELRNIYTVTDHLPPDADFDPESCYLGFEVDLASASSRADLDSVFEFMTDDAALFIIEPNGTLARYRDLMNGLPETEEALRVMFVNAGTLSADEFQRIRRAEVGETSARSSNAPSTTLSTTSGTTSNAAGSAEIALAPAAASDAHSVTKEPEPEPAAIAPAGSDAKARAPAAAAADDGTQRFVRVDARKLDQLINLVGELVVVDANVARIAANREGDADLQEASSAMSRLISEIRENALGVRMVPIGDTFLRFRRVVRELGMELGKEVQFVTNGGETELDKTVVERIADPLTHLVRNAIDHGLESAEERRAAGKNPAGTLELNAYHETGAIVIEVKDDGAGLNRDKILARAVEHGLADEGQSFSEREIFEFIFQPGFSTKDAVTSVSGRGVGLDVVKRNIDAIRGMVQIESEPGRGTKVSIRLPLTLAIIDGFLVRVGDASFVIPLDMVVECIDSTEDTDAHKDRGFLNLRGEVLPFINLGRLFGSGSVGRNIVVVQYGEERAGLLVDELRGENQTVIKPLGVIFRRLRGISGMSILGSGQVAMILDVHALIRMAAESESTRALGGKSPS